MTIPRKYGSLFVWLGAVLLVGMACSLSSITFPSIPGGGAGTDCSSGDFVVTVTLDINDGACDENCSLREAVLAANACPGENRILLGSGVHYTLSITGPGDGLGEDEIRDLNIRDDLVIVGDGMDATVIESSTFRSFSISAGVDVSMQDLTIQEGNPTGDGGAILNAGNLSLTNVALRENSARGNGGGIANSGSLDLTDVIIDDNHASRGGGIYNTGTATLNNVHVTSNQALIAFPASESYTNHPDVGRFQDCGGGINNQGTMSITESHVSYNHAFLGGGLCNGGLMDIRDSEISWNPNNGEGGIGYYRFIRGGGGIFNYSDLTVNNGTISGNQARAGGGSFGLMLEGGTLRVENSDVQSNRATDGSGGGFYLLAGDFEIVHSVIADNTASLTGGGMYLNNHFGYAVPRMNTSVSHSAIIRNEAIGSGGGINHSGGGSISDSVLEIFNTTISGNEARRNGGGVYERASFSGTSRYRYVTIADNQAVHGVGGGIYFDRDAGRTYFKSTVIATNTFWECAFDPVWGHRERVISEGYNVDQENLCNISGGIRSIGLVGDRVGLTSLTEIGGTFVHELLPDSVARDRVDTAECAADGASDDQRGLARPVGDGCDSGAYELDLVPAFGTLDPLELATVTPTVGPQPPQTTEDTLCWQGPGPAYDVVSSIAAETDLELLGRGENNEWLVATNPIYAVPCWLPVGVVRLDPSFDVSTLEPIPAPILPTPTATAAPAAPSAPANLAANTTTCSAQDYVVTLNWFDAADNEDGFRILRDGAVIATVAANSSQYTDHPPYSGPHTYQVVAFNAGGEAASGTTQDGGCVY